MNFEFLLLLKFFAVFLIKFRVILLIKLLNRKNPPKKIRKKSGLNNRVAILVTFRSF